MKEMKSCYRSRHSKTEKFVQKREKVEEACGNHCQKTKSTSWILSQAQYLITNSYPILRKTKEHSTTLVPLFLKI